MTAGADAAGAAPAQVRAVAVPGLPEVTSGCDLAGEVARACAAAGTPLTDADVVVVASKVVAKAEGRLVPADRRDEAVAAETVRVVAQRTLPDGRVTRVVQSRSGPVMAAAGVDASDVPEGTALLLPADPDASARTLRAGLRAATGCAPAVVVSDTSGRPWRAGVTDFALGAAGLVCLDDVRGRRDRFGRPLEVTVRAVADEVAALADLVKGKAEGTPVAVVSGLGHLVTADDGPGAGPAVRVGPTDWFSLGVVEAGRHVLGVGPHDAPPPPLDPGAEDVADTVRRAVLVAAAGDAPAGAEVTALPDGTTLAVTGVPVVVGAVAQRLVSALRAEGLVASADLDADPGRVRVGPEDRAGARSRSADGGTAPADPH